jgi:hypothetical protein
VAAWTRDDLTEVSVEENATASSSHGSEVLASWSARRVPPVVVLYVVLVFAGFMAIAHFVVHSPTAVKALAIAAAGAAIATLPSVLERIEYRLTASGVEKRAVRANDPPGFEEAFRWDELTRIVPMRRGFKYIKMVPETNALRRFWNLHISDEYSGEIHIEKPDLDRVLDLSRKLPDTDLRHG